jgi:hypothetical protein
MTEPDRYGEEIRRALSAAAELVVPVGDGLDIIRKRAARRPPMLAWLLAYVSYLPRQMTTRVRVMASELAIMARGESELLSRLRARFRPKAGQARSAQAWLRPALAAAGALLLVVSVTLAVPQLRERIANQANTGLGGLGRPGAAAGGVNGTGTQVPGASGSSSSSYAGLGPGAGLLPTMPSGQVPGVPGLWQLPLGTLGVSPTPCVTGTSAPAPSGTIAPTGGTSPTGSPGTVPGGGANAGAPNDPAGQQSGGYAGGQPNCAPSGSSTPTTPPTSTPPTSTPPTSTPPTSTPPTSTPPTSTPPTSTPPTSDAPSSGSTASTPADAPSSSGS